LLREGLNRRAISVTGNTVVDALKMILKKTEESGLREKLKVKMGEIKKIKAESKTGEKSGTAMSRARKPGRRGSKETASWLEAILERGRPTGPKSAPAARPIASSVSQTAAAGVRPTKLILVTAHRRESFGEGMERICQAISRVVSRVAEAEVIFPVHLNPQCPVGRSQSFIGHLSASIWLSRWII